MTNEDSARKTGRLVKTIDRVIEFSMLHKKPVQFHQEISDEIVELFAKRVEELGLEHEWKFEHCNISEYERYGIGLTLATVRVWKPLAPINITGQEMMQLDMQKAIEQTIRDVYGVPAALLELPPITNQQTIRREVLKQRFAEKMKMIRDSKCAPDIHCDKCGRVFIKDDAGLYTTICAHCDSYAI